MRKLQLEHAEWLAGRFPDQPGCIPAAGMIEEAGELLACFVAAERIKLYGAESRHKDLDAKIMDAIGDCFIYFVSYCNSAGWNIDDFVDIAAAHPNNRTHIDLAVRLVSIATRFFESRAMVLGFDYVSMLRCVAQLHGWRLEDVVWFTWEGVKTRCK